MVPCVCADAQGEEEACLEGASSVQGAAEGHTTGEVYPLNHDADRQLGHQTAVFFQPVENQIKRSLQSSTSKGNAF